ncbi:MAG: ACP S-malonyltransferase [Candidatus Aenigmarchaeota archaeon]|nr:ACP S-malonyltransferase [Candidatus Aenigmarchaeota archaeon]
MGRIAYVFPGQGSQKLGMARDIYKNYKPARAIFKKAYEIIEKDKTIDKDIIELCIKRPPFFKNKKEEKEKKLSYPTNIQPALFLTCAAFFQALESESKKDWYAALGHSLGEYPALYAADAFDFEEGFNLVKKRAECMTECSEGSGMVAIYGSIINSADIEEICRSTEVNLAIDNNYQQIVIGGYNANLEKACELAKKKGYSTFRLNIEGSPHTNLMKPASEKLGKYLKGMNIRMARKPIIGNTSAKGIVDTSDIRKELEEQLYKPFMFQKCVRTAIENGADTFVEIGPGSVVSGIIKRINPNVKRYNVEDEKSLEKTLKELSK